MLVGQDKAVKFQAPQEVSLTSEALPEDARDSGCRGLDLGLGPEEQGHVVSVFLHHQLVQKLHHEQKLFEKFLRSGLQVTWLEQALPGTESVDGCGKPPSGLLVLDEVSGDNLPKSGIVVRLLFWHFGPKNDLQALSQPKWVVRHDRVDGVLLNPDVREEGVPCFLEREFRRINQLLDVHHHSLQIRVIRVVVPQLVLHLCVKLAAAPLVHHAIVSARDLREKHHVEPSSESPFLLLHPKVGVEGGEPWPAP